MDLIGTRSCVPCESFSAFFSLIVMHFSYSLERTIFWFLLWTVFISNHPFWKYQKFVYREAWWCYPLEALEAVAVHLMWIAAATYCALLAPKNLLATLIGVLGMAHFSLGLSINVFKNNPLHYNTQGIINSSGF